ncbi:MAG: hypothetical protein GC185_07690 [Alphaproteobacteria bacterium]|nr:hypothetical protein [Alphaproteobacteria bacterium]
MPRQILSRQTFRRFVPGLSNALAAVFLAALIALPVLAATARADEAFDKGRTAYNKGDWGLAIAELRPLAEEGDGRAMVLLGNMYSEGHGVQQDAREAYTLYRRAAFHDIPDGIVALATFYQTGTGTRRNVPLAIQWFQRGARLGSQGAQFMYALHCYRGYKADDGSFDMKPDALQSYKWLRIAATHGGDRKIRHAAYSLGLRVSAQIKQYEADEINREVDAWAPDTPDTIGPNPEQAAIDAQRKKIMDLDIGAIEKVQQEATKRMGDAKDDKKDVKAADKKEDKKPEEKKPADKKAEDKKDGKK